MNKFLSVFLVLAVVAVRKGAARVPTSEFYPYGQTAGDLMVPTADDNFVAHDLSPGSTIYFFNQPYDKVFVNNNGGVSFVRGVPAFTPTCGPQDTPMIIPFWADVDTTQGGNVWYRESTEPAVLAQATRETLTAFPGLASTLNIQRVFIATWDNAAFFGSLSCGAEANAKRNSFQTVIATDGHMSFIILNYDSVNWITGRASGGDCNGRGGTPAKAGFDTGDNVNFFSIPGSCTEEIDGLVETTNINMPGKWIFRVDQDHIEDPTDPMPEPVTDDPEEIIEPGHCNPDNCNLQGYCYQYAQCDYETRTYRNFYCSNGLYWNPHNNSIEAPGYGETSTEGSMYMTGAGRSLKLKRQLDHHEHDHTGAPPHHEHEEECHGSCDIWENLSPQVQAVYQHDEQCFPKCFYAPVAECENRYVFHPHNSDARHVEYVHCPIDNRHGRNIPLVWVQERETCDLCYNAYRTDVNGTVSPCCERYDDFVNPGTSEAPGSSSEATTADNWYPGSTEASTDSYYDNWSTNYPSEDHTGTNQDYRSTGYPSYDHTGLHYGDGYGTENYGNMHHYAPGRSLNKNTINFDNKRKI